MKRKFRIFVSVVLFICMLAGTAAIQAPRKVYAESADIYQVNGKYTITTKKLVTKCKLETADSTLKKKTRTYKITSKTKIQKLNGDSSKTTMKGSKRKKVIKRLNKKNEPIQFKAKKGKVIFIWYNIYG